MSEKSWVLHGVDAEARQAALAEAERRGLSLSDYLTEVLLGEVLAAQVGDEGENEPTPEADPLNSAPPRAARESFAFRHRVEALERRLTVSVSGLNVALQALDSTVLSLTAQLDETGALAEDGSSALIELTTTIAALRKRLSDAEESAETLLESNEEAHDGLAARCAALEAHLTSVEAIAYAADAAGARLAAAQDALQRTLAQDFNAFAHESERRFATAHEDMRALAEDAAAHADAAATRAIEALRITREAMERSLVDHAEETRSVVHGAFVDAAERIDLLADRVLDNQRIAQRMGEQLNARLNNIEDAVHTAIEDSAETLRQADAALRADIARAAQEDRAALAEAHARHEDMAQRVQQIDSALTRTIADVAALHAETSSKLASVEHDAQTRLADVIAHLDRVAETVTHDFQTNAANIDRVEACTFAALEKLARDIASGDAAQLGRTTKLAARLDLAVARTQETHADATARLAAMDRAVKAQEQTGSALGARLQQLETGAGQAGQKLSDISARVGVLERAAADSRTALNLAALTNEVEALAAEVREKDTLAQLNELRALLAAQDSQISENADRAHGVARMLSRVTAQSADVAAQVEERMHKLEIALADVRLDATAQASASANDVMQEIASRVDAFEQRQADALDALRADIAHFIDENDRRLAALEQDGVATLSGDEVLIARAIEARLTELEQRDVGADFETLRRRVEDRILGVERSSVRALEQMADTIALIERRYLDGEDDLAQSA